MTKASSIPLPARRSDPTERRVWEDVRLERGQTAVQGLATQLQRYNNNNYSNNYNNNNNNYNNNNYSNNYNNNNNYNNSNNYNRGNRP